MDNYLDLMRARREQILERFYAALDRAGRSRDAARLIAVSKTVGVDETITAIQVGYRHFAENRPQELVRKLAGLAEHPELPEVRFDMIGNLQTNKINAVLGSAELSSFGGVASFGAGDLEPCHSQDRSWRARRPPSRC